MSTYQTDARIDDSINTLPAWQQAICRRVRDLVHAADPEVTETIKRDLPAILSPGGQYLREAFGQEPRQRLYLRPHCARSRRHYQPGARQPDRAGDSDPRGANPSRRESINERALLHLLKAVIADNRAGGWRKVRGSQELLQVQRSSC